MSEGGDASAGAGWRARLALVFKADAVGATRLVSRQHEGPLVVQRSFYPEGPAVPHIYVLHPPGGVVGGDQLHLDVACGPGAHALLTTPAATKTYRTAGAASVIRQIFRIADGGWLEWLPQETILHDGTDVALTTEVHLDEGAGFVGSEILCFGLPARGEMFARGRCRQNIEIWRGDRPVLIERGCFDANDAVHGGAWGLGSARVTGLLVVVPAPEPVAVLEQARARAGAVAEAGDRHDNAGVTILQGGEALVARYVGGSAERARGFLQGLWSDLRQATMGRPAVAPRIWAT
jgi:urease accessory protein